MTEFKDKKRLVQVSFLLAVAAIAGFCYMLYCGGMYPFGPRSLMRIDLDTQYADFIQFFARSSFMEKLYSFQKGFGGPTLGFISYYAISPFNLIVLLFSGENLETAVFVILAAKFVFMAEGMYVYLCSHYDGLYENAAFGLAYAFFPVFARWYYHIIWLDCFALLPLLILGTERVIHGGRKGVFTMLFLWSLISNYYITVMSAIFVLLYFVYYTSAVMGYDIKIIIKKAVDMALAAATAILLAAPVLLPSFIQLTQGKLTDANITVNHAGRMFDTVYLLSSFFEGMYIYNVPQICGGVCTVFLVAVFMAGKKIPVRKRVGTALFTVFMVYSFCSGTLHYVMHGFSNPIAFSFRHNYLIAFLVLAVAREGLENADFHTVLFSLPCTLLFYAGCFMLVKKDRRLPADSAVLTATLICVVLCTVIMLCCTKPRLYRGGICVLIAVSCAVNAGSYCAADKMVYDSVYPTNSAGDYRRNYVRVKSAVDSIQDSGFYRIADIDARDYNQPMGLGYYGTNHYSSTFDKNQKEMFVHFGYPDTFYSTIYSHSDVLTDSLWGIKYLLRDTGELPRQYVPIKSGENGNRSLYCNPYRLPLMFGGNTNTVEYINYHPQHIEQMLYVLTGEKVLNNDYSTNFGALKKAADSINARSAEIISENGAFIKLRSEGEYLLSTVMYDENWHIWVNGEKAVPERFMEYFLSVHTGGRAEITMIYIPQGLVAGLALMSAALVYCGIHIYLKKRKIYE